VKLAVMAGRLALVVGSQCDSLPELSFVEDGAGALYHALLSAGWQPVGENDGLLLDPVIATLKEAVGEAFKIANDAGATLLFAFIGHGVARGSQNFYLMAADSPSATPNSDNAFHLPQFVNERLIDFPSLDGLVFLVDACQAKEFVEGAAARWTEVLAANRGRMELLVASGVDSAYDGCFTKTILSTFEEGRDIAGDNLLCADLRPAISDHCWRSQTQYLAYSGGDISSGDRGLWLVPNVARCRDAVAGRPTAGLVDQLTTGVIVTDMMRETLAVIEESASARLRLVVGAAGSGKSTLLGLLVRPKTARVLGINLGVADDYVKAAVFLDTGSTLETLAAELAVQLSATVPEFTSATAAIAAELTGDDLKSLDSWAISVTRPLSRCATSGRIHVIVDGLDQPQPGARDVILAALQHLTCVAPKSELGHVRVIAGVRSGEAVDSRAELAHVHRIDIIPPGLAEVAGAATTQLGLHFSEEDLTEMMSDVSTGGWLIARLVREVADHASATTSLATFADLVSARIGLALSDDPGEMVARTLSLIAAAGVGPVFPIELLGAALSDSDTVVPAARVRNAVVRLGALITRGHPGTDRETLGVAHQAMHEPITAYMSVRYLPPAWAHRAIIDAHQQLFTPPDETPVTTSLQHGDEHTDVAKYWVTAAPRHYLGIGDSHEAVEFLKSHDTPIAADNRDRWAGWLPAFTATLGPYHSDTLAVRERLVLCRGSAGDIAGAIADCEALLGDRLRLLGSDHPDTLNSRQLLAGSRAQAGDRVGAITEMEAVLADRTRVQGPDHADVLWARHTLISIRGNAGDVAGAIAGYETLVSDMVRVLGPDHPSALHNRGHIADWRAEAGDFAGAIAEYEALLADRLRVQGPDHVDVFSTRSDLAELRARAGDTAGAIADYEALLADRLRVQGRDHPIIMTTRANLARWRGEVGDVVGAVAEYEALLAELVRVVGPYHQNTLACRGNLAYFRSETGDMAGAIAEYESLLRDEVKVKGKEHPGTFNTRNNLASLRGRAGDAVRAVAELRALVADKTRVLGPDHPETLNVRANLSSWRGHAGDVAGAIAAYESLLADRTRILGADHPNTLQTRNALALRRGEAGQVAAAVAELEALLVDVTRVLGPNNFHTRRARHDLAYRRGAAGDLAGAFADYQALLTDLIRVLGPDNPETLHVRGDLARWRAEAGDMAGAIAEYEALLGDVIRVLGPDHRETLRVRERLARWRGEAGETASAVADLEVLLGDQTRLLGADHPNTLKTRGQLARWRGEAGNAPRAVAEFEALVANSMRVLGPEHPDTLSTRRDLARWRGESRDVASAVADCEALLGDQSRVLRALHPDTLKTRGQLARWRGEAGDALRAVGDFEALVADCLMVLGPQHPDTLNTRRDLARWRGAAGDAARAVAECEALHGDQTGILGADHPDTLKTLGQLAHWQRKAGDVEGNKVS
jgi:hypothetical protein